MLSGRDALGPGAEVGFVPNGVHMTQAGMDCYGFTPVRPAGVKMSWSQSSVLMQGPWMGDHICHRTRNKEDQE